MVPGRFLVPGQLCGLTFAPNMCDYDFTYVYYVSDIHLETQYEEYCKSVKVPVCPVPMSDWIETVMDSLFSGDFLQDIDNSRSFIVLFLGDIAETFAGSELFYKAFMRRWDKIDESNRQLFERQEAERQVALQAAQHEADVRIVEEYKALHPWTKQAKRQLTSYKRTPDEVKAAIQRIEQWERGETLDVGFVHEFHPSRRNVYAVLGNHEIYEFTRKYEFVVDDACLDVAYEQGKKKYKDLFQSLGVHFLDIGNIFIFAKYESNLLITGFCGFNDPQCTSEVIGNYEIKLRDKLVLWYDKCVEYAKSKGCALLFCTHFPLLHGTVDSICKNNAYYFCGHTHRDEFEVLSETGAIIADNQIGYGCNSHKKLVFERIGLYPFYNPFDSYENGCYEIKIEDYQRFCIYSREGQVKTGLIEKYLSGIGGFGKPLGDTGKLYMIKRLGYYGFFIACNRIERVYICNGGVVTRVPDVKNIEEVLSQFDVMVDAYLLVFSGLRRYQEQIASYIRSFGGRGTIHGLIVDIDFVNHVGINPVSGNVTFYYSPWFGTVQSYSDMGALLEKHAPELYPAYKQLLETSLVPYYAQDAIVESELVEVKRGGNSFYGASRYVSPIQRLFSCNILRVWDENVLNKAKSTVNGLKIQGIETEKLR